SLAPQVFLEQVCSQANLCVFMFLVRIISDNAGTNTLTCLPARCVELQLCSVQLCSGGRARLRGRKRAQSSPVLETTILNRESPAPGAGSILRHAGEPTQLLCGGAGPPPASTISRGGVGRAWPATAIRRSRCCRGPQPAFDPAKSLLAGALRPQAT